jgi:hypothetical protein
MSVSTNDTRSFQVMADCVGTFATQCLSFHFDFSVWRELADAVDFWSSGI